MQLSRHIYIVISIVFIIVTLGLAFISDQITAHSPTKPNQAIENQMTQ